MNGAYGYTVVLVQFHLLIGVCMMHQLQASVVTYKSAVSGMSNTVSRRTVMNEGLLYFYNFLCQQMPVCLTFPKGIIWMIAEYCQSRHISWIPYIDIQQNPEAFNRKNLPLFRRDKNTFMRCIGSTGHSLLCEVRVVLESDTSVNELPTLPSFNCTRIIRALNHKRIALAGNKLALVRAPGEADVSLERSLYLFAELSKLHVSLKYRYSHIVQQTRGESALLFAPDDESISFGDVWSKVHAEARGVIGSAPGMYSESMQSYAQAIITHYPRIKQVLDITVADKSHLLTPVFSPSDMSIDAVISKNRAHTSSWQKECSVM